MKENHFPSPPGNEKADLRGIGQLGKTDDAAKVKLSSRAVNDWAEQLRNACRRQVEQLQEAIANVGYRLPCSCGQLKAFAAVLLTEIDCIPLNELPGIALRVSRLRLQLERFDRGEVTV